MAERDLPGEGTADDTPLSFNDAVDDISNLLGDPETPDPNETETEPTAAEDDPTGESEDEFPDAEDAGDDAGAEDDGSEGPDYAGGRWAADSARVKLDDGSTITIGELKRNNLYQRDYTQKTTALAEERKSFDAERAEVSQYAQQLSQARDFHAWFAETYLPKPPDPFRGSAVTDPAGYAVWRQQQDAYDAVVGSYRQFQAERQQEYQQTLQQQDRQSRAKLDAEYEKLVAAYPLLKDDAKRAKFWEQTYGGAQQFYGLSKDDVRSIPDHRVIKVIRDAIAYRRLKAAAPGAKDEAAKRPAMGAQGGKRRPVGANAQKDRQARGERLRATGTLEAGVAALMDFDL